MQTRGVRKAFLSFLSFFCILPTSLLQDTSFCTVYSRSWPMRGKWAPFRILGGGLFQEIGFKKGVPLKVVELIGTEKKGSEDIKRP